MIADCDPITDGDSLFAANVINVLCRFLLQNNINESTKIINMKKLQLEISMYMKIWFKMGIVLVESNLDILFSLNMLQLEMEY